MCLLRATSDVAAEKLLLAAIPARMPSDTTWAQRHNVGYVKLSPKAPSWPVQTIVATNLPPRSPRLTQAGIEGNFKAVLSNDGQLLTLAMC